MRYREEVRKLMDEFDSGMWDYLTCFDILLHMITLENVDGIIQSLPPSFRAEFVGFCRDAYSVPGEHLKTSRVPLADEAIEAVRWWLIRHPSS